MEEFKDEQVDETVHGICTYIDNYVYFDERSEPTVETTYAATVQNITKSAKVVCRKTVAVKAPSGYKNCKYSSTNPKVASIDAKGKLKALRLGVTTITVKSGTKKKSYTITVVPEKKSDVRLNQELILGGQMVQLKLVSDKYDTSQIKAVC